MSASLIVTNDLDDNESLLGTWGRFASMSDWATIHDSIDIWFADATVREQHAECAMLRSCATGVLRTESSAASHCHKQPSQITQDIGASPNPKTLPSTVYQGVSL